MRDVILHGMAQARKEEALAEGIRAYVWLYHARPATPFAESDLANEE